MKFFQIKNRRLEVVKIDENSNSRSSRSGYISNDDTPYVLLSFLGQNEFPVRSFFEERVCDEGYNEKIQSGELKLYAKVPVGEIAKLTYRRFGDDVYLLQLSSSEEKIRSMLKHGTFKLSQSVNFYCSAASYLKFRGSPEELKRIEKAPPGIEKTNSLLGSELRSNAAL